MELIRILILGLLAAIVASLGMALYHLSTGRGDSNKMLRALTLRISLSVALFVLLMIAWRAGLITPHGLQHCSSRFSPSRLPAAPAMPWARTPLSLRMSSVAATISLRGNTSVSPPRLFEPEHDEFVLQIAQQHHQMLQAAHPGAVHRVHHGAKGDCE